MAFGCSSLCAPVQSSKSVQDRFEDVALVHAAALVHRLPALMLSFAHPTPADCKRLDVTAVAWTGKAVVVFSIGMYLDGEFLFHE